MTSIFKTWQEFIRQAGEEARGATPADLIEDSDLGYVADILDDIRMEREAQVKKWGVQHHPMISGTNGENENLDDMYVALATGEAREMAKRYKGLNDAFTGEHLLNSPERLGWDTILLEEVYEALELLGDPRSILEAREEFVQVAAVAAAIVEDIDRSLEGDL